MVGTRRHKIETQIREDSFPQITWIRGSATQGYSHESTCGYLQLTQTRAQPYPDLIYSRTISQSLMKWSKLPQKLQLRCFGIAPPSLAD